MHSIGCVRVEGGYLLRGSQFNRGQNVSRSPVISVEESHQASNLS